MQKAHEVYEKELAQVQKEMYIQAFIAYEEIKECVAATSKTQRVKGTVVQKKHVREKGGKTYCYTYSYLQFSEYVDGQRKVKRKYISKEELPQVIEQLHNKKGTPQTQAILQQRQAMLKECEKQLQKYIRKGLLLPMQTLREEAIHRYAQQKEVAAYRTKQAEEAKDNPHYKIRTAAGELVVSKNECIVANLLYHYKIPYFYEKPLRLKPKQDGSPMILHPDFTIRLNEKDIYIEVLGMMEAEGYANNWEYRLTTYKINGISLGKNLVALELPQEVDCLKVQQIIENVRKNNLPQKIVCCGK